MIFAALVTKLHDQLAKRQLYKLKAAEILDLSVNELADLRADRGEMLRYLRNEIYGVRAK
jgi:hypothetical protein